MPRMSHPNWGHTACPHEGVAQFDCTDHCRETCCVAGCCSAARTAECYRMLRHCIGQVSATEEAALLEELWSAPAPRNRGAAAQAPVCSVCRAALPNGHLLSLHIAEVHDSFFAAQAARKLKVRWQYK